MGKRAGLVSKKNGVKVKSDQRWQQFNWIVDHVAPSLPTATHLAVLVCCFRHGRGLGEFSVSTPRIAEACNLKKRRTRYILDELEQLGVIELLEEHRGPLPRTYKITFKQAIGALQCTPKETEDDTERSTTVPPKERAAPQINGALQSI